MELSEEKSAHKISKRNEEKFRQEVDRLAQEIARQENSPKNVPVYRLCYDTLRFLLRMWKLTLLKCEFLQKNAKFVYNKQWYFCNSLLAKGVDWIIKIHVSLFDLQE